MLAASHRQVTASSQVSVSFVEPTLPKDRPIPSQKAAASCPRLLIRRVNSLISQLTSRGRPTIRNPVDALGDFKLSREYRGQICNDVREKKCVNMKMLVDRRTEWRAASNQSLDY